MKRFSWIIVAVVLLALNSCQNGVEYPGYKLVSKKFVKEVNADCFYFEHEKSGARVFKITADDPNKTFAIAFKTITDTDCGTPHILEHCVLEGSKNFPVKSPFDEMAKGSLQTFLNAMTGKDITIYPVASMNEKDYFNLVHVYLDAVFNPLVLERPTTFYQEGWHHELFDPDGSVVYKGVVYNEMKGAFSGPDREMYYQQNKNLFPEGCYRFSSGGRPEAIPGLTYDQFIGYYEKHYHPSNSYIYLYGDADLGRELAFLDSAYLSNYEKADMDMTIPLHDPFESMKEVVKPYSAPAGSDTGDQTMFSLSFVIGEGSDRELSMALQIIEDVLVNQESAPLRLALQEAGIGQDVSASTNAMKQQVFEISVRNANPDEKELFRELVFSTLNSVVEEGLDKEAIEGTINRMEFRLREGDDAQKGMTYGMGLLEGWLYAGNPYIGLEYEAPVAAVKAALSTDYLEQIILKKIINNPHALLLVLVPKPGLEAEITAATETELAEFKAGLAEEEVQALIKSTEELLAHQDEEDSPEALATIPKLSLEDVNPESAWYDVVEKEADGLKILHYETFTNNILYTEFIFDLRRVKQEMIPYVSLMEDLLGTMNTENYSYEELEKALNIHTGGFYPGFSTFLDRRNDHEVVPKLTVEVKAVNQKSDKLIELVEEIVLRTDYSDQTRLKNLLNQTLARVEADVMGNGISYAYRRQAAYHSEAGVLGEAMNGISFYWFLRELVDEFETRSDQLVETLESIASALFTRENMIVGLTCSATDYEKKAHRVSAMAVRFPEKGPGLKDWEFTPEARNEGLLAASKVQFVMQGANYRSLGYEYSGHMMVLNNILSRDWLHQEIRVKGGAYGGFGRFLENGQMYLGSYRDPNLGETLETFAGTPQFVEGFESGNTEMTQYIIGTIGDLDYPKTPSEQGSEAIYHYFTGKTAADQQRLRSEVISTTLEEIHSLGPVVRDAVRQNTYCVYGNQEKLQSNEELFGALVPIMK